MAKKKTIKQKQSTVPKKVALKRKDPVLPWVLLICGITAVCLWPMLDNEFTNWDDEFYVINNKLLRGPDWQGIFTEPVVGNYHPFTVMTLAFNYAISATDPFSYLLVNYLLHLINTARRRKRMKCRQWIRNKKPQKIDHKCITRKKYPVCNRINAEPCHGGWRLNFYCHNTDYNGQNKKWYFFCDCFHVDRTPLPIVEQ